MRPIKKYIALFLIFFSITYAQNVSIKIDFTSNFYSQFQPGVMLQMEMVFTR